MGVAMEGEETSETTGTPAVAAETTTIIGIEIVTETGIVIEIEIEVRTRLTVDMAPAILKGLGLRPILLSGRPMPHRLRLVSLDTLGPPSGLQRTLPELGCLRPPAWQVIMVFRQ
mmetsp:Transcript_13173/g.28824  ORF Transcript_13173/g.28824 Transcript_13173/m.28824 type:complete len:115 (-) Transcript_13173:1068-1412(-)